MKEVKDNNDFFELIDTKTNVFEYVYNLISFPILLLHELLHIIFGFIVGLRVEDAYVSSPRNKNMRGVVYFKDGLSDTALKEFFVSFSPILIIIIPLIFSFFTVYAIPFLIWVIIAIPFAIPSKTDLSRFLFFKELKIDECEINIIKNLSLFEMFKKKLK